MLRVVVALLAIAACAPGRPPPADTDDFDEPEWARSRPPSSQSSSPARAARLDDPESTLRSSERRRSSSRPRRASGARIDMDFRGADLENVFRMLATAGGTNIVIAPGVSGSVTLRLKSVPWYRALLTICRAHHLEVIDDGAILLIRPRGSADATPDG